MKKLLFLMLALLLGGCASRETFETVEDWYYTPAVSAAAVRVELPEDAAVATQSDGGSLYLCDGYSLCLQTLEGGDLNRTLQTVTGFPIEKLQLLGTATEDTKRYDFVWAAAGEGGDQLCRGAVLDDGSYHYTLCVIAQAEEAGKLEACWQEIFRSFTLDPSV